MKSSLPIVTRPWMGGLGRVLRPGRGDDRQQQRRENSEPIHWGGIASRRLIHQREDALIKTRDALLLAMDAHSEQGFPASCSRDGSGS